MAQTKTPMKILITDGKLADHPEIKPIIETLIAQGHTIDIREDLLEYKFVAGPNCWYCVPEVAALFNRALEQARKVMAIEKKALPKKEKTPKALKAPSLAKQKKAKKGAELAAAAAGPLV